MKFKLAVLPGDGIGPDVTTEAVKVLLAIGEKFGHKFELKFGVFGGIAIDQTGEALPKADLSGTTPRLKSAQKTVSWVYARTWVCLPICGPSSFSPCLLTRLT